jgi:hypothetical protein
MFEKAQIKSIVIQAGTISVIALATVFRIAQTQESPPEGPSPPGTIQLRIRNRSCAALSPLQASVFNQNPGELNNGSLDPIELAALREGCTLEAEVIAPNGMRLTDVPLMLLRFEAGSNRSEPFGGPRRSNDYGRATWQFPLTPNTDFLYEVVSPNPVKNTARSNRIEIRLCTGDESVASVAPVQRSDAGRGCR